MAHPRWPGFNTKTGNPEYDNHSRRLNRRIWKDVQRRVRVTTPRGRRRKKQILRVEGGNYILAIHATAKMLYERDHPTVKDND
ncbi:hypothetical protein [Curtobacterium sp. MCSS17_016]|uniref:hypothetical protein n=1 Tax=Curtobacterium sp. MCSS17_016 TaxID=2175644 RepID=UPI000DA7A0C0|nr:hypothetical protein [Curtobacterium sp. MCSS17_016]WIE81033.1 hypothetical protein DEJ19_021185 [Curtobacterium sp. MCSS17_016]